MSGDHAHIAAAARAAGCESLREAAVRKAVAGVTTLEEALRVTQG
jgi:type II secretory ATPase GspE/PulE/Tfp pilus assembly ATPase PilB-like protein